MALDASLGIVAYLALFFGVGLLFIFVNLLVGWFLRPSNPHKEKLEIYECGEPTIGTSFVQFDLRFYVVALLFIIFDVEVAFFFPWATVFGKTTHMAAPGFVVAERTTDGITLTDDAAALYRELGVRNPAAPNSIPASLSSINGDAEGWQQQVIQRGSRQLAIVSLIDIAVFFFVLLVGFAYVWKRGDLDWVRAVSREQSERGERTAAGSTSEEAVLSA